MRANGDFPSQQRTRSTWQGYCPFTTPDESNPEDQDQNGEGTIMRSQFATGAALLTAGLFAAPRSASAADTVNKAEDKVKDTTHEVKDAVSDSWLTSKTKIALFADSRGKGHDVRCGSTEGKVFLRGKVDSEGGRAAA